MSSAEYSEHLDLQVSVDPVEEPSVWFVMKINFTNTDAEMPSGTDETQEAHLNEGPLRAAVISCDLL